MARYKCTKCDETCYSKNVAIRHAFPSDQVAAVMTNIVDVMTNWDEERGRYKVTFEFPYLGGSENKDIDTDVLEIEAANLVRGLSEEEIGHWLCNHKWEHTSGKELGI